MSGKSHRRLSLIDFLKAYKKYDPAARSLIEIALLYPGPKAIGIHRLANFFYRSRFYFLARLFCEIGRFLTGIEIHPGAKIGKCLVIDHGMGLVIGETAEVGDYCILFHGVTLGGVSNEAIKRHPTLGNRVLVGAGSILLGPIHIGDDAKVGAGSFVMKNVPAGRTAIGSPAKLK